MSESLAAARPAEAAGRQAAEAAGRQAAEAAGDPRRTLQLALATIWLLDGVLQYQPSMFTRAFPRMLGDSAHGNPAVVAAPITWTAAFASHHLAAVNALFAAVQVALGLGIAWRPAVRIALAASVAWSLGVWWIGEGLGGVLAGTASLADGAPGAALLYAVLAVLLWPADREAAAPFAAARGAGPGVARGLWLAVWGSMALYAVLPAPRTLSGAIADQAPGEPAWLAWLDRHAATAISQHGPLTVAVLAALLATVAAAAVMPARRIRPFLIMALALAAALGLAQGLGGILAGSATDPASGPLLALLALSFWPQTAPQTAPQTGPQTGSQTAPQTAARGAA